MVYTLGSLEIVGKIKIRKKVLNVILKTSTAMAYSRKEGHACDVSQKI